MKQILKLLLIAFFIYWCYWGWKMSHRTEKLYIVGESIFEGPIKIEVPSKIVKEKDCKALEDFVSKQIRPGFPLDIDCPWIKVGKIGVFEMNGVTFTVPREYLWLSRKQPDGKVEGLYMMFKYPSFEAGSRDGDQSMNIEVSITPRTKKLYDFEGVYVDGAQMSYFLATGIYSDLSKILKSYDLSKNIKDAPEVGMKAYVGDKGYIKTYFEGELLHPSYWLGCGPENIQGNPKCESSFMYIGNNRVKYSFSRRGLIEHHREIKRSIEKKLNEFKNN